MSVLVTGAGRGVGRAIALSLWELGPVVLLARSRHELEETATLVRDSGGTAIIAVADAADETQLGPPWPAPSSRPGRSTCW